MNRKKLVVLLVSVCLALSGCNFSGGDDIPGYTTSDSSNSQTVSQSDPEDTSSVTPENTEITVSDTEGTEETTSDTEKTDNTDESGDISGTDEDTTTSAKSDSTTTSATTSATTATTTTKITTTTTQPINAEPSPPTVYATTADGKLTSATALAVIDYSNTSDGYVMAKYMGSNSKVMVRITYPNGATYSYNLNTKGNYEVFPLTGGNGSYSIIVGENTSGNSYAIAASCTFNVSLSSSNAPYLRPSQYVNFSKGDAVVTKASQLCAGTTTTLQKIERIYAWVVENVTYDHTLADAINSKKVTSYVSNPTKIVNEKVGICYDYAVGIAAMLRSQNIPTQVVFGDAYTQNGTVYHAWVNVYTAEKGWVYGAIYFDGTGWRRMDPTFAASSKSSDAIMKFIDSNGNYSAPQKLY